MAERVGGYLGLFIRIGACCFGEEIESRWDAGILETGSHLAAGMAFFAKPSSQAVKIVAPSSTTTRETTSPKPSPRKGTYHFATDLLGAQLFLNPSFRFDATTM